MSFSFQLLLKKESTANILICFTCTVFFDRILFDQNISLLSVRSDYCDFIKIAIFEFVGRARLLLYSLARPWKIFPGVGEELLVRTDPLYSNLRIRGITCLTRRIDRSRIGSDRGEVYSCSFDR